MGVHQNICLIHVAIAHMSLLFREYISFYKTIDIGSRLEVLKGHSCDIEAKCLFLICPTISLSHLNWPSSYVNFKSLELAINVVSSFFNIVVFHQVL